MDDEEEDTSGPVSQLWRAPFQDLKFQEPPARTESRPAPAGGAVVPRLYDNNNSIDAPACGLRMQHRVSFHGNGALRSHLPSWFQPLEDRGADPAPAPAPATAPAEEGRRRRRRREEDDRMAERPGQQRAALSVEAQLGQKLREIGDKFQQDHIDVFLRQRRRNLPAWMRLTMAVLGFLLRRPPPLPGLGAERR